MLVEMLRDAGASYWTLIDSDVEIHLAIYPSQSFETIFGEVRDFGCFINIEFEEFANMSKGANQQVPWVVGVSIKYDVGMFTPCKDERQIGRAHV